jgi:hypothetical protein
MHLFFKIIYIKEYIKILYNFYFKKIIFDTGILNNLKILKIFLNIFLIFIKIPSSSYCKAINTG